MRYIVAVLVTAVLIATAANEAQRLDASHVGFSPPRLWSNLEAGGTHRITYSVCAVAPHASWEHAIEVKWDAVFPGWTFDKVPGCGGSIKLDWEGSSGACNMFPDAAGCYFWTAGTSHAGHVHYETANIYFDNDPTNFYRFTNWGFNWQTAFVAHEWGHMLGLNEHGGNMCADGTIVGIGDVTKQFTDEWCANWSGVAGISGPTLADRSFVLCTNYSLCPPPNNFQSWLLNANTPLGQTLPSQWTYLVSDWSRDGFPDLVSVKMNNTGSGLTEVHVLSGATNFSTFGPGDAWHFATPLAPTDSNNWAFSMREFDNDGTPDLIITKKQGTTSTEVHVLSGASNFWTFGPGNSWHFSTPLEKTSVNWRFEAEDYNRDGSVDLYGIKMYLTGSQTVEIHILAGPNFSTFGPGNAWHFATPHAQVATGYWSFAVYDWSLDAYAAPDVWFIKQEGTATTEVHVLSGESIFQSWSLNTSTPLVKTNQNWQFDASDRERNGRPDLNIIELQGAGATKVRILKG